MAKNIDACGFGLTKYNQEFSDDSFVIKTFKDTTIAIVCDGVGSANAGREAAIKTCDFLLKSLENKPKKWSFGKSLNYFAKRINTILFNQSSLEENNLELITTLAVVVIDENKLYGLNVGDSRIYLKRANKLTQLSIDHSDAQMYGALTQAIGIASNIEPHFFEKIIQEKDKILLCSDGLSDFLDECELATNLEFGANFLVQKVYKNNNQKLEDDTTAVVIGVNSVKQTFELKQEDLLIAKNLKPGDIIDGYLLDKSFIQSNLVWKVSKNNTPYVLKFAPEEVLEYDDILDNFVQEVWNANKLNSPYFPKASIPKDRTYRYYQIECVDGISLKEYLQKSTLSIEDSISLAIFLLNMATDLLKHDLIHGDIKPENIMVMRNDSVLDFKMVDFGSIDNIFTSVNLNGTPSYIAPERFTHSVAINEKTEIFAIGVTLYQALTNKYPYGEVEPFQNPEFNLLKNPNKLNKNIPDFLNSIILRAITIDEDKRYGNYSQMLYELKHSDKVELFFDKSTPLLQRDPLKLYKNAFLLMLALNIYLLIFNFI